MKHPYAEFLAKVEKPARYVGGEYQEVRKDPASVKARVCLAFPDVYEIGMSHLGTKILYSVLNKHPDIACERAFSPWLDCEAELRARGMRVLTLESAAPLAGFDVIGFSLQYELTYTNVLNLLDLSGLPLRAADRGDDAPFVIAGGPTATHPEPLAPFIDAFFIGEAEEHLPPLVLEAAELRRAGVPRRERLVRLAAKYPLYAPELYTTKIDDEAGFVVVDGPTDPRVPARPKRVWVDDINRFPFPDDSPLPYAEAIFDRMAVEVARGCTEGCRFCQAGMIYRPVRERDPVAVIDALVGGVKKGGYDETALTSLSTADYSCVTPLVKAAMAKLRDEKVSLSVSSLRAYGLNEDLLGEMATVRAGGLTFAPEAGTQRMRDVITKNVTEEDISESARRVFSRGFSRMKLYFMIGLPTEEDVDVRGIAETAARVQKIGREHQKGAQVTASASTHVPKPHTPFQWCAMDTEAETERKQALLAETAKKLRVDLKMHANRPSHIEGIFSRGDRRAADLLERAFRLGCRFDGWEDVFRMELWERAIEELRAENGLEIDRYLGTIPVTARVPWDHIDIGLDPDFLKQEYRKALKDRLSPPCGKIHKRLLHPNNVADAEALNDKKLVCYDCGVACDLNEMKAERLYYLRRMNAWTPPVSGSGSLPLALGTPPTTSPPLASRDLAEPPRSAGQSPAALAPEKKRQPTAAFQQGEAFRYRLRYAKVGRAAYLGHLDLVRHLPRIFRRAGVELYYSVGFHPKPELTFGPALGLGIPSLGELMDVSLTEDLGADELLARLRPVSLPGVEILEVAKLGNNDRALGRVVSRAEFAARLPDDVEAAAALALFASAAPLVVRRESDKGLARTIDVRKSLVTFAPLDDADARRRLDWATGAAVRFSVGVSHEGSARPIEVVRALFGDDAAAGADFARLALWANEAGEHGAHGPTLDPMRLEQLRRGVTGPGAPAPAP
jgi:radical SAM family uncharacterized protein/radical SAM-linked protein